MQTEIYVVLQIVLITILLCRKTTKNDHRTKSATNELNLISVQTDNWSAREEREAAIINQTIQDGSGVAQKYRK